MSWVEDVTKRINDMLSERGLSEAWLQRQTGIPSSTLRAQLNGDRPLMLNTVDRCAEAHDTTMVELCV